MSAVRRIFFSVFWFLIIHGCAGIYSTVNFEILEPATVDLPEYVEFIAILNRTPSSFELFERRNVESLSLTQLAVVDTLINHSILRGLNEKLRNSNIPAYRIPLWFNQRRADTVGLDIPLTKKEVNDFCEEYGCNAIISMEYYKLAVNEFYSYYEGGIDNAYYQISSDVKWAIYLPEMPRPFNEYTTHDTLYYTIFSEGTYHILEPSSEMVRAAAFESGLSYGGYLVPSWTQITRVLYKGREKVLKETSGYTNKGDWDRAYHTWDSLLTVEDSTLAAKAAYNMAIFHELEDDLDTALIYVQLSQKLDSTDLAESYNEDLEIRILNKKQVLRQVRQK